MNEQPNYPSSEWTTTGEVPPGPPDWLQTPLKEHLQYQTKAWQAGLPKGHEPVTVIDGEEVKAENIVLRIGQKANEFGVHIAQEAGEHKKIVTTLTVAGLLLAIKSIHSRRQS